MEVASGDYGSDLTKIMVSGVQKLYGDRFKNGIVFEERVAVTDGEIDLLLTYSNKMF